MNTAAADVYPLDPLMAALFSGHQLTMLFTSLLKKVSWKSRSGYKTNSGKEDAPPLPRNAVNSIAADKTRKTVKKKNSIWTVVLRHRKSNETLYPPNDINNPWIPPFHRDLTPKYPPITYGAYGTIMLPMDLSPFTVLLSLNITPVESTEEMQADSIFRIWLTTQRVTPDIVDQSWMQEDDGDFDSGACLFEGGKVPEILVPDGYTNFQRRTLLALYDLSVQKWTAPPIRPTKDKSLSRILAINLILNKTISELNRYL